MNLNHHFYSSYHLLYYFFHYFTWANNKISTLKRFCETNKKIYVCCKTVVLFYNGFQKQKMRDMKLFQFIFYILLLYIPLSSSTCPNLCYGHGVCTFDVCECEDLYHLAPDCSLGYFYLFLISYDLFFNLIITSIFLINYL